MKSKNDETTSAQVRVKAYVMESILTSTTHGIDKIFRSKRTFLKALWLFFFAASTGGCGYFITKSILDYLNYEVVTKIQVIYEIPQLFPTVSICSTQVLNTNASVEFAKDVLFQYGIYHPFYDTAPYIGFNMTPALVDMLFKYVVMSNFKNSSLTTNDLKNLGITYDKFFLSCTFNLANCTSEMFEWYFDIVYGSCFRFNYQGTVYSYRSSDLNGLRIELYIPDLTDVFSFAYDMGARILIHNASLTSESLTGVKALVGTETNIQVERQFIHKLESPYSECIEDIASYGSSLYEIFVQLGQQYTQSDCYGLCYQTYLLKACRCLDPLFYPIPNQPVCMNTTQLICDLENYLAFFGTGSIKEKCDKVCPLECDSETFKLTISSSSYPTKAYADQLVNYSENVLGKFYSNISAVTYKDLKEHFLAVNVYYSDMKYTSIEELEKTSLIDLVSAIGGTLGLFIGMSFLSFLEFVDVLIETIFILAETRRRRKNNVSIF